jgi:ankyrin repeat protein
VASGYFDLMRLLVEHGADVHAQDASGEAPLRGTVHNVTPETVTFLVEEGAARTFATTTAARR